MKKKLSTNLILTILLILILFFSLLCFLWLRFYQDKSEGYVVHIYQDGKLIHTYSLSDSLPPITITSKDGGFNTISITASGVSVIDADCPHQTCMHQGEICNSLLPITCIPHGLVIELHPNDNPSDFDADTY